MRSAALAGLLLLLAAEAAWARTLSIDEFHAEVEVRADGVVAVTERIDVRFEGSWNGILRVVPEGYTYRYGVRGTIRLEIDAVEDDGGRGLEHWISRSKGRLVVKIRVPGAHDAVRRVVLRYRARNVLRREEYADPSFGVLDELYWNVTGNDWEMPIRKATALVRLPASVPTESIRAQAWTGPYGATETDYRLERLEGNALRFETTAPLATYGGLTVVVGFPPGHVEIPSALQRAWWDARANWQVLIPLGLLCLWFVLWWKRGRDPRTGRTVIPEFEAPAGLTPAAAGVLADDRLDPRDVTATVVDLAVRRILTIEETDSKTSEFRLRLDPAARDKATLARFESALLDGMFAAGNEVDVEDLHRKFQPKLRGIRDRLLGDLVSQGLYAGRPDHVRSGWVAGTVVLWVALFLGGAWLDFPGTFHLAVLLTAPFAIWLALLMPRRTHKGMEMRTRVRGIEEYLSVAEKGRMAALPLGQVERLLPFAIALGMEDRWVKTFASLFTKAPEWYSSRAPFGPDTFGRSMGRFHGGLARSMWAAPRTAASSGRSGFGGHSWGGGWSGGGGFSGGGRSGGGFGGGGGGGW